MGGHGWVLLAEDGGESVHVVSRSLYLLCCCSLVLGLMPPVYCLVLQVTNDNKREYVNLVARHRMTTAIRPQIHAFLAGFWEIVPRKLIRWAGGGSSRRAGRQATGCLTWACPSHQPPACPAMSASTSPQQPTCAHRGNPHTNALPHPLLLPLHPPSTCPYLPPPAAFSTTTSWSC